MFCNQSDLATISTGQSSCPCHASNSVPILSCYQLSFQCLLWHPSTSSLHIQSRWTHHHFLIPSRSPASSLPISPGPPPLSNPRGRPVLCTASSHLTWWHYHGTITSHFLVLICTWLHWSYVLYFYLNICNIVSLRWGSSDTFTHIKDLRTSSTMIFWCSAAKPNVTFCEVSAMSFWCKQTLTGVFNVSYVICWQEDGECHMSLHRQSRPWLDELNQTTCLRV